MIYMSGPRLALLLMLLCNIFLSVSEAAELKLSEKEIQWIAENPVINVGNETDWPPFDFSVDGQAEGYSIDLIQLIAAKAGLNVNFISGHIWAELLDKLRDGQIDLLPAIYSSDERREYIDFTKDYFSQPTVIVVKQSNQSIQNLSSLNHKKVAGVRDFSINRELREIYPDIEIVLYDTVVDSLKAVSLGEADAYVDSIGLVAYALENNFVPNLRIIGSIEQAGFSNLPLHMGVRKGNEILYSIIAKSLAAVTMEERQQLAKKWLSLTDYEKRLIFTAEQTRWIRQHPTIKVGLDAGYPPYSFVDEQGNYVGVAMDFLQLVSEKTGIKFIPEPGLEWQDLLNGLKNQTLAVAAPVVQTIERDEYIIFSPAFISAPMVIMTRDDNGSIKSPEDITQQTIALVKGYSSSERVVRDNPRIKKLWVTTPLEGLEAVSIGEADAFIGAIGVNIYISQQQGINNLQVAGTYDLKYDGQRFAIRSDWPQLAVLFTKALESVTAEQRSEIYNRWIKIPDKRAVDYSLVWKLLVVFVVILAALFFYTRRLSREVAQRALAENKLTASNTELEKARQFAEQASKSKSHFVSMVSHELKTPLNAIIGFSDLLRFDNSLKKESREQVEMIYEAGDHLSHLIDDLLDLSSMEAGKIELHNKSVNLVDAVNECLGLVQQAADKRQLTLKNNLATQVVPPVLADPVRLRQVLLNLLSNAIKYNNDAGTIELSCQVTGSENIKISISDSGIGISEKQLHNLFVYFERAGAELSAVKGTGIGLALSKNLVELMGGAIGVSSVEGKGSTFWFSLKLA